MLENRTGEAGGARGRGVRGADFGARGADQHPPAPLPTLDLLTSRSARTPTAHHDA